MYEPNNIRLNTNSQNIIVFCVKYLKELSFCHKLKSSDSNICETRWGKPLIFQTQIMLSIRHWVTKIQRIENKTLWQKINSFIAKVDGNWYEGERNGMVGIFPTTYVNILPSESTVSEEIVRFLKFYSLFNLFFIFSQFSLYYILSVNSVFYRLSV